MRSFWFEANYVAAASFFAFRRYHLAQKLWCYVPVLSVVSDDRDRLSVVSREHANDQRAPSRLKTNAIANSELQHLGVRAHVVEKAKTLDDPIIQFDEFSFGQFVDINLHWSSYGGGIRNRDTDAQRTKLTGATTDGPQARRGASELSERLAIAVYERTRRQFRQTGE